MQSGYKISATNVHLSVSPLTDEPQRIAFKEFMCRKFNVQSVNDLPMSDKEYCDWMDCWEEAISFRNLELLEYSLNKRGN